VEEGKATAAVEVGEKLAQRMLVMGAAEFITRGRLDEAR
jgi:hypothetical protein